VTWGGAAKVGVGSVLVVGGVVISFTGVGGPEGGALAAGGLATIGLSATALTIGNALVLNGLTGRMPSASDVSLDFAINLATAGLAGWGKAFTASAALRAAESVPLSALRGTRFLGAFGQSFIVGQESSQVMSIFMNDQYANPATRLIAGTIAGVTAGTGTLLPSQLQFLFNPTTLRQALYSATAWGTAVPVTSAVFNTIVHGENPFYHLNKYAIQGGTIFAAVMAGYGVSRLINQLGCNGQTWLAK